jgi:hypothetical protein
MPSFFFWLLSTVLAWITAVLACVLLLSVHASLLYWFTGLLVYLYAAGALEGAHTARLVRNPHVYRQPAPHVPQLKKKIIRP